MSGVLIFPFEDLLVLVYADGWGRLLLGYSVSQERISSVSCLEDINLSCTYFDNWAWERLSKGQSCYVCVYVPASVSDYPVEPSLNLPVFCWYFTVPSHVAEFPWLLRVYSFNNLFFLEHHFNGFCEGIHRIFSSLTRSYIYFYLLRPRLVFPLNLCNCLHGISLPWVLFNLRGPIGIWILLFNMRVKVLKYWARLLQESELWVNMPVSAG